MNWNAGFAQCTRHMKRSAVRELLKLSALPDMISFAGGLPAPELFPIQEVKDAIEAVLARVGPAALQYGETEGLPELRDWITRRFSRPGLPIGRGNVVIVSGAQQGLDLIGRIFLDEGDKVVVENPTYLALLSAWRPLGVQFLAVPSDADGMAVEKLAPLLRRRPKLVYSIPNFQNPQGTTLSLERRAALVELVRDHDVVIVEDDPYGELRFEGESLPSLFELDALPRTSCAPHPALSPHPMRGEGGRRPGEGSLQDLSSNRSYCENLQQNHNTIYVGTFSKVLMPGLRVGWVIAPEDIVEKIVQAKQAVDLHTSTLSQHVTYELVGGGLLEKQIPLLRKAYRERRDAMLSALENYFPRETTWTRPEGGMFLMVSLPVNVSASEVLNEALRRKVAFVPGDDFHLDETGRNTFRLNFSNAQPERIVEGVRRLASVLPEMLRVNQSARSL